MESIITIVGFLGAGKTTLLKHLVQSALKNQLHPYIILNDYADANLDAQYISDSLSPSSVKALTGSCICCDGINELRDCVNNISPREGGITLIEANGTSDASRLMEFLGVGLNEHFHPPIQISVVDVRNWQKRDRHNELEAEQVKVGSLMVFTHCDGVSKERIAQVEFDVREINPLASITTAEELDVLLLSKLEPIKASPSEFAHHKTHWSSCSIDLPDLPDVQCIKRLCDSIPSDILRIKGCVKVSQIDGYTHFERCPDGSVYVRPYHGSPVTGPKLLAIGPGSEPNLLRNALARSLHTAPDGVENK
ncbi:MAG: GTP-binding protein [Granulosicoccus sp.]